MLPPARSYGVTSRRGSPESFRGWARLDSNQGPRDYESPALPLSYRPSRSTRIKHTKSLMTNPESFRGCSTAELQARLAAVKHAEPKIANPDPWFAWCA